MLVVGKKKDNIGRLGNFRMQIADPKNTNP